MSRPVLRAADAATARNALDSLPLVVNGVARLREFTEVIPPASFTAPRRKEWP